MNETHFIQIQIKIILKDSHWSSQILFLSKSIKKIFILKSSYVILNFNP
jgi:hypothetical protein